MTLAEAMSLTRSVSSHAAFEDAECKAYFDVLSSLSPGSLIVEVGLEYGRSSSIALQVAKANSLRYHGIDEFRQDEPVFQAWMKMARGVMTHSGFQLSVMRSQDVVMGETIHAILIDGGHDFETVLNDCYHFLPNVAEGGYAMFHDYGRESLPEITRAVDEYMKDRLTWRQPGELAGTLGIWRKR